MHTPAIDAMIRIVEPLPESLQQQVVEMIREYVRNHPVTPSQHQDILELDER
ncbi:MAG: hypothetical protein AMXMBFR84_23190 [Candidatus Hydrogenedentota bacterium]